jgi:nucleoside-diphosphate-sugar epimerase
MSHEYKDLRVALVTGATGYIGSNLVKRMVSDHWQVHIVVRRGSNLEALTSVLDQIVIHEHNGTTKNLIDIVSNSKPEIIFHLASLFIAQHKPEDLEGLIVSNIMFSTQIAEAAAHCNIKYLINTSSSWQHYENQDYLPVNLYSATKQSFEDILKYYVTSCKLKVISLVLFDTYGPNDNRPKLIPSLIKTLKTQERIEMSKGGQLIDLVYIDDVVDAYLLCSKQIEMQNESYLRYGVSSLDPMSLIKIVNLFELTFNKKLNISWGKRPYRINEVMVPWNKYTKIPGWMPKYSLTAGLQKIIEESNY